ncbi:baculovirus F protein domain-containing protein [Phthorimaea operculella]|nr:baculovirus F protein domain-containing protein [Phthorimaea operculella]
MSCNPTLDAHVDAHDDSIMPSISETYEQFLQISKQPGIKFDTEIQEHNDSLLKAKCKLIAYPTSIDLDDSVPYCSEIINASTSQPDIREIERELNTYSSTSNDKHVFTHLFVRVNHFDEMTYKDIFNVLREYRDMIKYWYIEEKEFAISDFNDPFSKLSFTKIYNMLAFLFHNTSIKVNIFHNSIKYPTPDEPYIPSSIDTLDHNTYTDYIRALNHRLYYCRQKALQNISASKEKSKNYYDSHTKPVTYQVNDMVYVRCHHKQNKALLPVWKGPFKIIKLNGKHTVTLLMGRRHSDEKRLAHLMKDNIHVIKSTMYSFNNSISKVTENEKHLLKNMEVIHETMDKITTTNDKLEISTHLNSLLNSLESIIMTLSLDIDDINNAILFSKLNILHPTVLNPHQLYSELDKHRNNLPKHYELPVSLTLQNMHEIIDISKLICYYHFNRIIVVVKIPLVLPHAYNLYNVIPLPVPYDISKPDTYVLIAPSEPYIAITVDHMFYSQIKDIDKCKLISEKCYLCVLVNVYSTIANPICETTLLTEAVSSLPESCSSRFIHGSIDLFHKISGSRWIYVQSEPGKCHITCNNEPNSSDVILFGTGILNIPKICKAFYKTQQFVPVYEIPIVNVTSVVSDFNIIMDDCCEKSKLNKTLTKLPFNKLDNINNLDSLVHASVNLDSFEKELDKLENPSHFQKYGIHYMSLSYVFTVIFFVYLLYRSRNMFCKNNTSGCCIQIFNQCHNNKTTREKSVMPMVVVQDKNVDISESSSDENDTRITPSPVKRNIFIASKSHEQ